jgi:hypothetical protein
MVTMKAYKDLHIPRLTQVGKQPDKPQYNNILSLY